MSTYRQLTLEERCSIARLREAGQSIRQIAAALDREPSTVSRELKRNGAKVGYRPAYAQAQAAARCWHGSRLEREDALREAILDRLAAGWSPEQVSGRLRREVGNRSSAMRRSIASFTPSSNAPTTGAGATICHAPSTSAAGGPKGAGRARPAGRSTNDPARSPPAARPGTGKPTPCSSPDPATP